MNSNKFFHLTLDERRIIEKGIENGSTKAAIAKTIGKEKSTVGKEIKLHRMLTYKTKLPRECDAYRKCRFKRDCFPDCPDFVPFVCNRRDRSPGACNGCPNMSRCRFNKFVYRPEKAHKAYREVLVDSRQGVDLTFSEVKEMGDIVAPLLNQGLSPYQIVHNHPELNICEKTLYNYIENDIFHEIAGITVLDLRRQVSRKPTKKAAKCKKRQDRSFLHGRTYKDYQQYLKENPDVSVVQMDTVYNDGTIGPFIQTFLFLDSGFLFAVYHDVKTSIGMINGISLLESVLGQVLFTKYVNVLLTDRGSEFSAAEKIEKSDTDSPRTKVFYCDPMRAGQKGSLENRHIALRYILPKGTDLRALGLTGQDSLNLALSHINSVPLEKFGGKTPFELVEFMYPDLFEKMVSFGINPIKKDKVLLKPYLLK